MSDDKGEWRGEVYIDGCPHTLETSPPSEADPRDHDWSSEVVPVGYWERLLELVRPLLAHEFDDGPNPEIEDGDSNG